MDAIERRRALRSALFRGDGSAVVALVGDGPVDDDALQFIGDGLLVAVAQGVDGAGAAAQRCVSALERRGWRGDDVLVLQLRIALGLSPVSELGALPADLEELAMALEGDPLDGGGRVDRMTGEVWQRAAIDYAREVGDEDEEEWDEDRWLWVHTDGSRAAYRDMEAFIDTISDRRLVDRLTASIQGRGAFRRFRDTLARRPEEFTRWQGYSDDRQRGRSRAWLADAGYLASRAVEPDESTTPPA